MQFGRYVHFLWQPLYFIFVYIDVLEIEVHMFYSMQCMKMYFFVSVNVYVYIWGSTCIWDKLLRRLDAVRHGVSIGGACNRGHCLAVTVSQIQTQINKHTNTNINKYRTTNTLLERHIDQVHA